MAEIALLDGGLGQEIQKRASNATHPLWSVKVMFDEPDVVVDVHSEFIKAGARVISLNTYTATPTRMAREGFGEQLDDAHHTAIHLARQAIFQSADSADAVQLAGCLPPLVASYVAEVSMDYQQSLDEFRQIVALEKDAVDLFLIETMSNITEAKAAVDAAKEAGKPVFVGLTLADDLSDTLRSGEPLADAIDAMIKRQPDGILLNCSIPEVITQAMPLLANCGLPYGGYANGFTSIDQLRPGGVVDVLRARKDLSPQAYADYVEQWIDMGATIVGGCCEVGPEHIRYLAQRLVGSGHSLSGLH